MTPKTIASWVVAIASAMAVHSAIAQAESRVRVQVVSGTLEGSRSTDTVVFKGIPYAAAPLGSLRWEPPAPPANWSGVRKADAFGPACIQKRGVSLEGAGDPGPTSE